MVDASSLIKQQGSVKKLNILLFKLKDVSTPSTPNSENEIVDEYQL